MSKTYQEILKTMTDEFTERTGMEIDAASDIGIRMQVLAGEIYDLLMEIDNLRRQMFPHTATGEMLELHARERGLSRIKGNKAQGLLVFMLEMPLEYSFVIPAGTVCSTDDGSLKFVTKQDGRIERGSTMAWIPAEAADSGEQYNIGSGMVNTIVTYLSVGIRLNNASAFSGGTEDEGDEALRRRLSDSYREAPNGANAAFFIDLAKSVEGIQSANAYALENDPGWAAIILGGRGAVPEADAFAAASNLLNRHAPLGVRLLIQNPSMIDTDISVSVSANAGYSFSSVKSRVEEAVRDFMLSLSVGEKLYLSALGKAVLEVDGVENYAFDSEMADIDTAKSALLRLNTLTVSELS